MPNWCQNTLTVAGDPKFIQQFLRQAKPKTDEDPDNAVLSFENFFPLPEEEKENWYHWKVENWGTKWDACYASIVYEGEDFLKFEFDTAWSPPIGVIEKMSEQYPMLDFQLKYDESGCCFMGVCNGNNGMITDNCLSYGI